MKLSPIPPRPAAINTATTFHFNHKIIKAADEANAPLIYAAISAKCSGDGPAVHHTHSACTYTAGIYRQCPAALAGEDRREDALYHVKAIFEKRLAMMLSPCATMFFTKSAQVGMSWISAWL
jgi:hypothetical protein